MAGTVEQETLHFDPASGAITSLRSKEEAHDYRYFPEPDLLPVAISQEMIDAARADMTELPADRAERFERELGLSAESAQLLAFRGELGDYFQAALAAGGEPAPPAQTLANWVTGELTPRLGRRRPRGAAAAPPAIRPHRACSPRALAVLVGLRRRQAHQRRRRPTGPRHARRPRRRPAGNRRRQGLAAMDGGDELAGIVAAALAANADAAQRVREGNAKAIGPIVGHVMRETKGRADGTEVARLVQRAAGRLTPPTT